MKRWHCMILTVVCVLMLVAPAVKAEVDFSGEQITWIIPFKVGGGSDVWSRLYAPFFQKYLPGNPIVAVKAGKKQDAWEVDSISGATISSVAVAKALDRSMQRMAPLIQHYKQELSRVGQ